MKQINNSNNNNSNNNTSDSAEFMLSNFLPYKIGKGSKRPLRISSPKGKPVLRCNGCSVSCGKEGQAWQCTVEFDVRLCAMLCSEGTRFIFLPRKGGQGAD